MKSTPLNRYVAPLLVFVKAGPKLQFDPEQLLPLGITPYAACHDASEDPNPTYDEADEVVEVDEEDDELPQAARIAGIATTRRTKAG